MSRIGKLLLTLQLGLLLAAPHAFAQDDEAPAVEDAPAFTQAELDQMLAPVALYPDALLSQILMASTYPLEVVRAARWSRANPGLSGQNAVRAVQDRPWDPSVKSLVAFPQVLAQMDEKLEWTQDLGDAFLAQPTQVMDTVQGLRRKAYAAGNLESDAHYRVEQRGQHIIIESAYPDVVYVPYYDPRVVYGPWWWAGYPPVYWGPWPGYYAYVGSGFHWSAGIFVGSAFFFAISDWHHRHIKVVHVHPAPRVRLHRQFPHKIWRHDWRHRHRVKYRHPLVRQAFAPPHARHDGRHDFRSRIRSAPPDHRAWRDRIGRRDDGARRHDGTVSRRGDERRAIAQPGVGRLGMRPDRRLTSRHPNLPDHNKLPAPRAKAHGVPRHSQDRRIRRHDANRGNAIGGAHPRWRVNTPQMRIAPSRHAAPVPAARPKFLPRHQAGRSVPPRWGSGARALSGRQAGAPAARSLHAPKASGRTFAPRSFSGSRKFSGFRSR